jgi:hypothetical protein
MIMHASASLGMVGMLGILVHAFCVRGVRLCVHVCSCAYLCTLASSLGTTHLGVLVKLNRKLQEPRRNIHSIFQALVVIHLKNGGCVLIA